MIETNDRNDPRNQPDTPPIAFNKKVTVSLSKEMPLHTIYYEEHVDCDGRGYCAETGETDWVKEFYDEHRNIPELLEILSEEARQHIACLSDMTSPGVSARLDRWRRILTECQNWKVELVEVDNV